MTFRAIAALLCGAALVLTAAPVAFAQKAAIVSSASNHGDPPQMKKAKTQAACDKAKGVWSKSKKSCTASAEVKTK